MYKNNIINIKKKKDLFCYDCLIGQLIQKKLLKQVEWPFAKPQTPNPNGHPSNPKLKTSSSL